ncbi:MAG: YkgJ family cysteine cluster protein [Thaumarchaeota archaeon]|nr:YkgJ family cysteine cluster protein [Nitrososphaerota archaeon]
MDNSKVSMNLIVQDSTAITGSMKICNECTSKSCCTDFAEPLLFPSDLEKLDSIKKSGSEYVQEIMIDNKKINVIKKANDSKSCIFLNGENNFCSIYENRPFDCRMYPFDIIWINDAYHWIVYTCSPNSDWGWAEQYLQKLEKDSQFEEVMENREIFRLVTIDYISALTQVPSFAVLRKVEC